MRWLGVGLALLCFFQDKDTLKKSLTGMDDWKRYHYQISVNNLTTKKDEARGGEFVWPKIITLRKGITEIVKRSEKAMVNLGKGYKPLEEITNATAKELVERLEPPHKPLLDLAESMEKVQKDKKDEDVDAVKCKIYHSALVKEALPKHGRRALSAAMEKLINWTDSSGGVKIYVGKDDGQVHRVLFSYTFSMTGARPQKYLYEEDIRFFEIDKAKLNLPDDVKRALEITED